MIFEDFHRVWKKNEKKSSWGEKTILIFKWSTSVTYHGLTLTGSQRMSDVAQRERFVLHKQFGIASDHTRPNMDLTTVRMRLLKLKLQTVRADSVHR